MSKKIIVAQTENIKTITLESRHRKEREVNKHQQKGENNQAEML